MYLIINKIGDFMKDLSSKTVFFTILGLSVLTSLIPAGKIDVEKVLRVYQILVIIPGIFTLIYAFKFLTNLPENIPDRKGGLFKLYSLVTLSLILFPNILTIALSKLQ